MSQTYPDSSATSVGEPAPLVDRDGAPLVDQHGRPVRLAYRRRADRADPQGSVTGAVLLARVVHLIVSVVVLIIVLGIVLVLFKANPGNSVVSDVRGWAHSLAGPFNGMFSFHTPRTAIAMNWVVAAIVYSIVGALIAELISGTRRYSQ